MTDPERSRRLEELRVHEEEASRLVRTLAELGESNAPRSGARQPDVVFFAAQLMRHRISAALLAAELAAS